MQGLQLNKYEAAPNCIHRISKILFALGADEFLAMLEGKLRVAPFFKVQSGKITVCAVM